LIDRTLETFQLSVTGLNKYLECPRKFYFENILRIPSGRTASMGFGNAIHYAFDRYFSDYHKGFVRSKEDLIAGFRDGMKKFRSHFTQREYDDRSIYGDQVLSKYFDHYSKGWGTPDAVETEYKINDLSYRGVPIKGFIDKVEIYGSSAVVIDYKSGRYLYQKFSRPKVEKDLGGDLWRQIVFYRILVDIDKTQRWIVKKGIVDYVAPERTGKFIRKDIEINAEDIEFVSDQIVEVYGKIRNHAFNEGCEEEQCYWCQLVNNELHVDPRSSLPEPEEG
jgi:DNA helicase-2/ATP-dependent DNA helicase PcrA